MMKKGRVLLLSTIALFSCGSNIPKDIREFLSKIILKEEDIKEGHFTQDLNEKIDNQDGHCDIDFTFSRNPDNGEDINFKAIYNYSGRRVVEEITSKVVELIYNSKNNYEFKVTTNGVPVSETINYQRAHEYYYKIFDDGTNPYRFGGLYYGDLIAVKANQFYKKYSLNETKDQLTYEEKDVQYVIENMLLDQKIVIDQHGMLLSMDQYARQKDDENNFTKIVQTANYEYVNQQLQYRQSR